MATYAPPTWAHPPTEGEEWSLEEIKSGVVVAQHRLTEAATTFGRAAESVSIHTAHDSCSRLHARIAFDGQGCPWLRDLGSGNGTTVNRKALPRKSIGKRENLSGEGSRGVRIFPGDVVQFGASTRTYCLVGPPEKYDRDAAVLPQKTTNVVGASSTSGEAAEEAEDGDKAEDGVSWGIAMDDEQVYNDEQDEKKVLSRPSGAEDFSSYPPLERTEIPEKHRKLYERYMAKRHKMFNLQQETDRINRKGGAGDDLTEGQQNQLQRNQQRMLQLEEEIDVLERNLRRKLGQALPSDDDLGGKRHRQNDHEKEEEEEDVDDFYDRTSALQRDNDPASDKAETEESLTLKWKSLLTQWKQLRNHVIKAQQRQDKLEEDLRAHAEDGEDSFFIQNDLQLAKEEVRKHVEERDRVGKELTQLESLLRIVNNTLVMDRESAYIGRQTPASKETDATDTEPNERQPSIEFRGEPNDREVAQSEKQEMPPPPIKALSKPTATSEFANSPNPNSSSSMPPPPSLKRNENLRTETEESNVTKKRRVMGPSPPSKAQGTLSAILSATMDGGEKRKSELSPSAVPSKKKLLPFAHDLQSSKKDEWKAPNDQDGSGRTKLNDKFAGRY